MPKHPAHQDCRHNDHMEWQNLKTFFTRVMMATLGDSYIPSHASKLILCAEQESWPCQHAD